MDSPADHALIDPYQAHFARHWGMLRDPRVRALAWLLDAPGLLDPHDSAWAGKLAAPTPITPALRQWLMALDADPAPLAAALGPKPFTRLGLYAEKLMAFFYAAHGVLVAHGLQVRASRNDTVGEFDFLIEAEGGDAASGLEHIELATKFYLLEGAAALRLDSLIGPNLADSLGAKMRKIVDKQLTLAGHPAAQAVLTRPVLRARALVKGWLFYPPPGPALAGGALNGIAPLHCRGFWRPVSGLADDASRWVILPRLQWLAPYRHAGPAVPEAADADTDTDTPAIFDGAILAATLAARFALNPSPVLVAALVDDGAGNLVEGRRGFIVPDDWSARAAQRQGQR